MLNVTDEQARELRARYPATPDLRTVLRGGHQRGRVEANRTYLDGERDRAAAAMRALMDAVGVAEVASPAQAVDFIALACSVFAADGAFAGSLIRESERALRIAVPPCPVLERVERQGWLGVTACPSWQQRQGWFNALNVVASETIEADSGRGDPACITVVDVRQLRPASVDSSWHSGAETTRSSAEAGSARREPRRNHPTGGR